MPIQGIVSEGFLPALGPKGRFGPLIPSECPRSEVMVMSSFRVILWLSLLLLTMVGGEVEPAYAQVFAGSQPRNGTASAIQPHWFAVLGHVQEPRTFELPTASPFLVDVVWLAGKGPVSTASGQVRIVRGGRILQEFLAQTSRTVLQPGDIVIVDGRPAQGRIFRGRNSDTSGGPVRLALTGIRPWPIITEVPAERATLRWLTQQLGQSEIAAQKARALVPRFTGTITPDTLLNDCSVVLFDSTSIVPGLLPVLPEPVRLGTDPKAKAQAPAPGSAMPETQPSVTDSAPDQSPVAAGPNASGPAYTRQLPYGLAPGYARPPMTAPPAAAGDAPAGVANGTAEPGRLAALDPAAQPLKSADSAPSAATDAQAPNLHPESAPAAPQPSPRVAPPDEASALVEELPGPSAEPVRPGAEVSGAPVAINPDRSGTSLAEQGAASFPRPAVVQESSPRPFKMSPDAAQPLSQDSLDEHAGASQLMAGRAEIVPQEKAPWDPATIAVGVIGGLGALAAITMLLTTGRTPADDAVRSGEKHPAAGDRYWLDRIIENDLPVIEEPVQLPQAEQFFGRARPAAARPVHRVDAVAPQPARPHFPLKPAETSRQIESAPPRNAPERPVVNSSPAPSAPAQPPSADPGSPPRTASLRRIDARHPEKPEAPKTDVVIQPARSVTDGTDLLDRILSRVEKGRS